jgi:hypothetical protein
MAAYLTVDPQPLLREVHQALVDDKLY